MLHVTTYKPLLEHVSRREGKIQHFYLCGSMLVTIGAGLMLRTSRQAARLLSQVTFTWKRSAKRRTKRGKKATAADVIADFRRVKKSSTKVKPAKFYRPVAELRITRLGVRVLMANAIHQRAKLLHRKRPFSKDLPLSIQAAFVDVLYNPCGVKLFGTRRRIKQMWAALDPKSPTRDYRAALKLFARIWKGRGKRYRAQYQVRHNWRVAQFKLGVEELEDAAKKHAHAERSDPH